MTKKVLTVGLPTGLMETAALMQQNKIRRVPVMEGDRIIGIVTETDITRASPSDATTLSKNELTYLLAKLKIQDVLPKNQQVITIEADSFIETAARLMREQRISGLPVVEQGQLVGIITETDLFDALIDILGVKQHHTRLDVYVGERLGTLAEITSILAQNQLNIVNLVVFFDEARQKYKMIFRLEGQAEIPEEIKQKFAIEFIGYN
jgi:acetoin utilization protein AcuB